MARAWMQDAGRCASALRTGASLVWVGLLALACNALSGIEDFSVVEPTDGATSLGGAGGADGNVGGSSGSGAAGGTFGGAAGEDALSDEPGSDVSDADASDASEADAAPPCTSDQDCAASPSGPVCDIATGRCGQCSPANDPCPTAQFCSGVTLACGAGCKTTVDCQLGDAGSTPLTCNTSTHQCVGCTADGDCPLGTLCQSGACTPGCSATQACQMGKTCCSGGCVDVDSDPQHCGTCGTVCTAANGKAACIAASCAVASCNSGFGDCDSVYATGCETSLTTVAHCGKCATPCTPPNAIGDCSSGACVLVTCSLGWASCDGNAANGCESYLSSDPQHCGTCAIVCGSANGTAACGAGTCAIICNAGYGNCNGFTADGCEASLDTDPLHCGSCSSVCSSTNGAASCVTGGCQITCNSGFGNCNGSVSDGCEANLATDPQHCGTCPTLCPSRPNASTACSSSACTFTCNPGFADCNGSATDGCEVNLNSDVQHCGSCPNACLSAANATATCTAGFCGLACTAGYANCDGNWGNGCEVTLATDPAHCGSCINACPGAANATATCSGGGCGLACNGAFGNCDGSWANGCEANLDTDPAHCGSCPNACPAGGPNTSPGCSSGACSVTCSAGWGNCDGSSVNGCESNVLSDPDHCGNCTTVCGSCAGARTCSSGTCGGGTIYFYDVFADNSAGWTLDTEWAIGPTSTSAGQSAGFPDPALDHTPTADNGVAGVVLGGNAATAVHAARYLTSPAVNLSAASTVKLTFWRWLNCDSASWQECTIDVYTGSTWVNLYTNPSGAGNLVTDSAWTKFEYDVAAYKNSAFRVRFGLANVQSGVYKMSAWNVDDLTLSSLSCP